MFDALLTDFSKTLNSHDHKLLTAKLSLIHGYYKFLADLLFIISNIDIASYAHDDKSYIATDNIDPIKLLEEASTALFQWFDNNRNGLTMV